MIQPNELRPGNYFKEKSGGAIHKCMFAEEDGILIDYVSVNNDGQLQVPGRLKVLVQYDQADPIDLTVEMFFGYYIPIDPK